jgi:hypothetical protein
MSENNETKTDRTGDEVQAAAKKALEDAGIKTYLLFTQGEGEHKSAETRAVKGYNMLEGIGLTKAFCDEATRLYNGSSGSSGNPIAMLKALSEALGK